MTSRQKSLYLAAKLYELAAEFTDDELKVMLQEQTRMAASAAVQAAIRALIELHREPTPSVEEITSSGSAEHAKSDAHTQEASSEASSIAAMFDDRSAFPTVAAISGAVQIEGRPKESRERYMARVIRHIESMSASERRAFYDGLASRLNSNQADNFISRWSRLIKEM